MVDEAPLRSIRFLSEWKLVARDAFNGTLLWKRPLGDWVDHLRHFRSGPAHLPRRLVAVGDRVYVTPSLQGPVVALDAATGQSVRDYAGTEYTEEILAADGTLYLVVGTSEENRRGGQLSPHGEPAAAGFRFITAIEAATGKALWKVTFSKDESLLPLTLAVKGSRPSTARVRPASPVSTPVPAINSGRRRVRRRPDAWRSRHRRWSPPTT